MSSSDLQALTMPKWGMAMTEGTVVAWLKEEGDAISPGDELVEVETEKIVNAVEADAAGVLARRVAEEGDVLLVGGLLGVLAKTPDADAADIDAFVEDYQERFSVLAAEQAAAAAVEPVAVDVAGRRLRYLELGDGEEVIVLIHGMGGDLNGWLFNQPALAERYRVVALDLPGHGGSAKTVETGSLEELAEAVSGLLATVGIDSAHLVGHSLGGSVAVQLATDKPELVRSLTLIGSAGAGTVVNREYIDGFIRANRRNDIKPFLQQLFADPALVNRDMINDVLKAKRIDGVEACWRQIADQAIFAVEHLSPAETLSALTMPVQMIWGAKDRVAAMPERAGISAAVTVHVLDNVGHMPQMEAAGTVNDLIAAFAEKT